MIEPVYDSYVYIILIEGNAGADVRSMLEAAIHPDASGQVQVRLPDIRGISFLDADGPRGARLDQWWRLHIPPRALPMYLVQDALSLEAWIPGTYGYWFVAVGSRQRTEVFSSIPEPVFTMVTDDPIALAEQAMQATLGATPGTPLFHPGFPYRRAPMPLLRPLPRLQLMDKLTATPPAPDLLAPPATIRNVLPRMEPAALAEPAPRSYRAEIPPPPPKPTWYSSTTQVSVLPRAGPRDGSPASSAIKRAVSRATRQAARIRGQAGLSTLVIPASLGADINRNRPITAAFASRKGGVGKTTHAAAVAASVGEAFDGLPDTAALVDGNITNPDAWALYPPVGSATVRTLVSCLSQCVDPPVEQYSGTPRLAIYPESRESEEAYTQAEVDLVAEYLRRRHSFVAVDLPNALPSLVGGGPGAVAAAWLVHCDVAVLPFNADPRARQGLFEYVSVMRDEPELDRIPIVAPYVLSSRRAISRDAAVLEDIAELGRRGVRVVEIPDDQNALLALLRDLPINRASHSLRKAYLRLTEEIISAVLRARAQA